MNKKALVIGNLVKMLIILFVIFVAVKLSLSVFNISKEGTFSSLKFVDNILGYSNSPLKKVSFSVNNGRVYLETKFKDNFDGKVKTIIYLYTEDSSETILENTKNIKTSGKDLNLNFDLNKIKNELFSKILIELYDVSSTNEKLLYKETYYIINPSALSGSSDNFFNKLKTAFSQKIFLNKEDSKRIWDILMSSCYFRGYNGQAHSSSPVSLRAYEDICKSSLNECEKDFKNINKFKNSLKGNTGFSYFSSELSSLKKPYIFFYSEEKALDLWKEKINSLKNKNVLCNINLKNENNNNFNAYIRGRYSALDVEECALNSDEESKKFFIRYVCDYKINPAYTSFVSDPIDENGNKLIFIKKTW